MTDAQPRTAVQSRPDPRLALLEAIQSRQADLTRRLVLQWVHRRGLASLQAFQRITLPAVEGPDACRWLQDLLDLPEPPALAQPALDAGLPEIRLHDLIELEDSGMPAPLSSLSSVEAAFAALDAEFPAFAAPEPALAAAPDPADAPPVIPALPLSFEIPLGELPPTAAAGDPSPLEPTAGAEPQPGAELDAPLADGSPAAASHRFPLPRRLFRFDRVKSLVRDCFEEAIGSLQAGRPDPLEAIASADPEPAAPVALADAEPVAPLPAFHSAPAAGSAIASGSAPTGSVATLQPVEAEAPALPFRLPRLALIGAARRPAPSPEALADLRAWLPDADTDLPRAC